jgi:hypothetical protein
MGADGGVCWLKMVDRDRFEELARPFGFLRFDDYHDSNDEWYMKHAEDGYYYATYGTSQDLCMETMVGVIDTIKYLAEEPLEASAYGMQGVHKLSFYEAYLNKLTNPASGQERWAYWDMDKLLEDLKYTFGREGEREPDEGSIFLMTLEDWAEEISKTFEGPVRSEETWT